MAMTMYVRFMATLAFGLIGIGLVLKILLEEFFNDWDAFTDLGAWWRDVLAGKGLMHRAKPEDVLLEIEKAKTGVELTTRLSGGRQRVLDKRREQLKEISLVEHRLRLPNQPVVLAPLSPPAEDLAENPLTGR